MARALLLATNTSDPDLQRGGRVRQRNWLEHDRLPLAQWSQPGSNR